MTSVMVRKVKILIIAHDSTLYGASRSLLTLLTDWVAREELDLKVLLPYPGELENSLKMIGVNFEVVKYPRNIFVCRKSRVLDIVKLFRNYYIERRAALKFLNKKVGSFKPDLVYTNTSVVSIGYDLANRHRVPHLWHIREFGKEDYQFEYIPHRAIIKSKIRKSHAIFVSRSLQNHWVGSEYHDGSNSVIYNGLIADTNKVPYDQQRRTPRIVAIIGAIMPGKGQKEAILAIHKLKDMFPGLTLLIFGNAQDREYYDELEQLITQLNLGGNIFFKGFVDDPELLYEGIDIVVNCSKSEGFGRTIVESMSRGIPVVANNSGGIPEIILHGKTGLLYNHTIESLAEQLSELINDVTLYRCISRAAIEDTIKKYRTSQYTLSVLNLIKKIVTK